MTNKTPTKATVSAPTRTAAGHAAAHAAYQRTIRLDIREITRRLNASLGGTLVAVLAGSKDAKAFVLELSGAARGGCAVSPL